MSAGLARGKMFAKFLGNIRHEEGQGLVEYALILVLVAVALVLSLQLLAGGLGNAFSFAVTQIP